GSAWLRRRGAGRPGVSDARSGWHRPCFRSGGRRAVARATLAEGAAARPEARTRRRAAPTVPDNVPTQPPVLERAPVAPPPKTQLPSLSAVPSRGGTPP